MSLLRIGAATVNQTPLDWANNLENILGAIAVARQQKVDLLCFPELTLCGYGCEDTFLSHWLPEKCLEQLPAIAAACNDITVAVGLPIRWQGLLYNTACVIQNGEIQGFYAKQHLAKDGVHYEPRWFQEWPVNHQTQFTLGDNSYPLGDITFPFHGTQIGFEICEDAWRTTRPAPRLLEKGVKIILNPSASHYAMAKTYQREALFVESSLVYQCTYVYANLLGNEAGRIIYDGEILIAQEGRLLQRNKNLSFLPYQVLWADVDIRQPANSMRQPYAPIPEKNEEVTQAGALGLFDYLRKCRAKGFVLSLSGGADSSMCAVWVAEMVKRGIAERGVDDFCKALHIVNTPVENPEKHLVNQLLTCIYQASDFSSEATSTSAKELAHSLGATYHHWSIAHEVESFTQKIAQALGRPLDWATDDIALQNIQARTRSPLAWMLANVEGKLMLTTSNRSEGDVGYATMDGDTSGSLAPIAGLSKVFVLQWLQWAETDLGYASLRYVNQLAPSAELRPAELHQTDEKDLMPYAILAEIEKWALVDRLSPIQVYQKMKESNPLEPTLKSYIHRFFKLWAINQWKRERLAPSFHLDDWNVDPRSWCRFPILSGGFEAELLELQQAL
jgi:NAD+ synthase (glutamine-hydrolysing)